MNTFLKKAGSLLVLAMVLFSCAMVAQAETIDLTAFEIDTSDEANKIVVTWAESADAVLSAEADQDTPVTMTIACSYDEAYVRYITENTDVTYTLDTTKDQITFAIPGAGVYHIIKGTQSVQTYTVEFNSNGGSAVADIEGVTAGSKLTRPADPTKTGYVFAGWYEDAALTNAWDFTNETVDANLTLYAKWTAQTTPEDPSEDPSDTPEKESQTDVSGAAAYSPTVSGLNALVTGDSSNDDVVYKLTMDAMTQAEVPTGEKTAIVNAAAGRTLLFFDIDLTKAVNGGTPVDIGGQNNHLISITLQMSTTGKTHFKVYRYHGNAVEVLNTTANASGEYITVGANSVTIHAKRFSTYAVAYMENGASPISTITGVKVSPESVKLRKGASKEFTAEVTGTEGFSNAVAWSVSGNKSTGTVINSNGKLTVASNETARTLTVTATSLQDTTKYACATVTVKKSTVNANTGDTFQIGLWLALMAAAGIGAAVLYFKKRKK